MLKKYLKLQSRKNIKDMRVGDHIWYISDTTKFKTLSKMETKYNTKKIIEELIGNFK